MTLSIFLRSMRFILLAVSTLSAYGLSYHARILDCSGKPPIGTVVLQEFSGNDGYARPRSACTKVLDAAGRFSCDNLTSGRYAVIVLVGATNAAVPEPQDTPQSQPTLPTPLLTRETQEEGPIVMGEESQGAKHTLHVCTSTATTISANIPDKPGDSYINLAFRTSEGELATGVAPAYDPVSGKVLLPALAPGTYHLQAYWFANGADRRFDRILRIPDDAQNNLSLDPTTYSISGTVHMDATTGANPSGLSVVANCGQFGSMAQRKELVANDGSFGFRDLAAPECSFSLGDGGSASIVSMEVNDNLIEYGHPMLKPYPNVNRVDLIATSARGSITGRVEGKGAEAGSGVVACNLGSGECMTTKADGNGGFSFSALPEGTYRVSAWPKLDRIEYRVPAFMRQYAASNDDIKLNGSGSSEVSVPLSRAY